MKLKDIKPGTVVWNQWEYSIMGRDTGTESAFFLIIKSGKITKDIEDKKSVTCIVKKFSTGENEELRFKDEEIDNGCLRLATKSDFIRMKIGHSERLEKKILEHKTSINLLEIELSELDGKYQEFIDKAI